MATYTVAALFPHFDLRRGLAHEMAFDMVHGIREEMRRLDLDVHFYDKHDDSAHFWRKGYRSYAGVIGFLAWGDPAVTDRWKALARKIPAVSLFHRVPPAGNAVVNDDAKGVAMAVEHLVREGARSIGFFSLRDDVHTRRRFAAFRAALSSRGLTLRADRLCGVTVGGRADAIASAAANIPRYSTAERAFIRTTAHEYLASRPLEAVLCENDYLAYHLIAEANACGLSVPEDIAVIGFDNFRMIECIPALSKKYRPLLTSVDLDCFAVAREGVRLLYGMLTAQLPLRGNTVVIDPTLVVRASSCRRSPAGNGPEQDTFKARVRVFVKNHYNDPSRLKSIAEDFDMTYRSFLQRFKREFSVTFTDLVSSHRLERAAHLLEVTGRPITRILIETGYGSYQNFLKFFRKRYRLSPMEYRRAHLGRRQGRG
ncbi:MAG: substrate-binding domain-containing protein [Spirochaetota bacterium]